ncbi:zinc ribbon domain-containing protein [Oscillospiraceae bacterium CM]|nr:zinc ribbon domain-containing protein [Oscillospiraceae bacterium CM]
MFCSNCGTKNSEGNAFCVSCGAPLGASAPSAPVQSAAAGGAYAPVQTAVMAPPAKKPNYTLIGIISVAAVVVIIAAIVLIVMFSGGKSSLIGTWTTEYYGVEFSLTFNRDGTVVSESYGDTETSKYSVKGDVLTVTDSDDYTSSGQFKIYKANGKTALDLTYEGFTLTLYKK